MTKEQVPKEKIREEIDKEMIRNPRYAMQSVCVGGKLTFIMEESRKLTRNVKGLRRTYVCEGLGGVGGGVASKK